jgi:protein-S-isoprenylcysteine O-methyltransferase Ste14
MRNKDQWRARWTLFKTAVLAVIWVAILGWLAPQGMLVSKPDWHTWTLGPIRFLAFVPLLLGAAMCGSSLWNFANVGKGTLAPFDPPRRLVVMGFYRFVRNPIYSGVFLILLSEALLLNALSAGLLALVAAGFFGAHLFVVFYEERRLHQEFGGEYKAYLKQVPRWIPRIR